MAPLFLFSSNTRKLHMLLWRKEVLGEHQEPN